MNWDVLIKGSRVIDPGNNIDGILNIAVKKNTIHTVDKNHPEDKCKTIVNATGRIVTPSFIDLHVHNYTSRQGPPSVDSDTTNFANGVTTALDAGTATPNQYPHYWETDISTVDMMISGNLLTCA